LPRALEKAISEASDAASHSLPGARAAKTHRELFSDFYADLMREPLEALLAANPAPAASAAFFERMLADIVGGGGALDALEKVRRACRTCETRGFGREGRLLCLSGGTRRGDRCMLPADHQRCCGAHQRTCFGFDLGHGVHHGIV